MALLVYVGCIVLWIHPFWQAKSNIQTNLGQPESGRLRLSLKIWEAGNDGGARAQVWDVDGAVGATAKAGDEADGGQKRASKEKQIEENETMACIMLAEWPVLGEGTVCMPRK